ncbi:MFS transporter [Arenibacterium sp. CAU 1754]
MLWPPNDERQLLGRFYLSGVLGYAFSIILPFQFAYLYLMMEQPEWAVAPILVSSAVALAMEIPTGILSDRWSRKKSTIGGYAMSAVSWMFIPFAVSLKGEAQLAAVCICFAFDGLGAALVSGAQEAWAVDNVSYKNRKDLIDEYFTRSYSFDSLGSIIAGGFATLIVVSTTVDRPMLDLFWYVTAAGQIAALGVMASVPEWRERSADERPGLAFKAIFQQLRKIARMRPFLLFSMVLVVASFADSITEDAFVISMLSKGLDARMLAPLGIVEDIIGLAIPLFAVTLVRRVGVQAYLSTFLIVPAFAVAILFFDPSLWAVVALCLVLDICAVLWDPVAEAYFHKIIGSGQRATLSSAVNQIGGLAELAGIGIFAVLLVQHSEALKDAAPDLLDAFSGQAQPLREVPSGILGLSVPDLAIVGFVFAGLLAIPFLRASIQRASRDAVDTERAHPKLRLWTRRR